MKHKSNIITWPSYTNNGKQGSSENVFPSLNSERKEMQSILLDIVFQFGLLVLTVPAGIKVTIYKGSQGNISPNSLSAGQSSSSSLGSGLEGPKVHE